jgi:hydroxymethylpyrimidine/phosphomethylpyrimidine kinase
MTARPPTALTIAGSDSGGGAGLQADLKTFLAMRVHGMCAVTAVTVQNSLGVSGIYELPAAAVAEQVASVASDIGVDAAKTGMLASAPIIAALADIAHEVSLAPLLVDPVCASQHGDPLIAPDAVAALINRLFPLATLVTPNLGEVKVLTGIEAHDISDMRDAARKLHDMGPAWVLVKGGHLTDGSATDVLYDGTDFTELSAERRQTSHTHGTGDTLAAAVTAALAQGAELVDAVHQGKAFVTAAIDDSFALGSGLGPVGHFWRVAPL